MVATLPGRSAAWLIAAALLVVLVVSSLMPFVRIGDGTAGIRVEDAGAALAYLGTWIPFLALVVGWTARPAAAWTWPGHVLLLLLIPPAHTLAFQIVIAAARGLTVDPRVLVRSLPFPMLTVLGSLQYLVVIAVLYAVRGGRAAERSRSASADLERDNARLQSLLERHSGTPGGAVPAAATRLAVRNRGRITLVDPREIDWVEALGNYVRLHLRAGTLQHRATMDEMEGQLGPAFVRLRRSVLVRKGAVRYCEPMGKGSYVVVLGDQTRLTSSRYYRDRMDALLGP